MDFVVRLLFRCHTVSKRTFQLTGFARYWVFVIFALLFVEAESERIDGFVVSVEGVDEVLAPDSIAFSVIVEVADAGDFVPGFLGDRVVEDDVAIPRPARFTVFLESFKSFMVELLFVPVVLREELVESAFVSSWKDFA